MTTHAHTEIVVLRDHLRAGSHDFVDGVYMRLFAAHPELRALFPANLEQTRRSFGLVLDHVLTAIADETDPTELVEFLGRLARDHRKYGLTDVHYTWMYEALMAQWPQLLGSAWTPEVAASAQHSMLLLTGVMRGAAHSAQGPAWVSATVVETYRVSRDAAVIRLIADAPLSHRAGQYVEVSIQQWPTSWRMLSPATPPNPAGQLEFHVQRASGQEGPGSEVTGSIVTETRPGDVWRLAQAHGALHIKPHRPVIMIAEGAAAAPLRAMVFEMAMRADSPLTWFFYCGRHPGDLFDLETLTAVAATNPWLRVIAVTEHRENPWWLEDRPTPDDLGVAWRDGVGIDAVLQTGSEPGDHVADHQALIAGSAEMMIATRARLIAAGLPARYIQLDPLRAEER